MPYEKAIASLVFEPLGLSHSFFAPGDVMTRRFAVGHKLGEDGTLSIARLWKGPRDFGPCTARCAEREPVPRSAVDGRVRQLVSRICE
jgi:CubicO group peptidase (beta-lactamase class C family)